MKFPLSWIKEFIDIKLTDEEVAKILTSSGLEVDAIEKIEGPCPDSIFEISLTPNLNHCNSIVGVARELSAATGIALNYKASGSKENPSLSNKAKIIIQEKNKCPRYACRLILNVSIKPSPEWLKNRIEACGLRSVNNVVDITNLVLMELGHPLHAFDFDALSGGTIIVRNAQEREIFTTLDHKQRQLSSEDLVICDQDRPVAIAGVMGGIDSEVKDTTSNILLESAYFQPTSIRRTSKRHGLQTDSSKRFERGADPNGVLQALDRAAQLILETAGGDIAQGIIDIYDVPILNRKILCRLDRANSLLGIRLSVDEIENIFKRLEFKPVWNGHNAFEVEIPSYRVDITTEIDLIEEIARLYGYDNIPKHKTYYVGSHIPDNALFIFERKVRSRLMADGLQEFLTCDLIGPSLLDIVKDSSWAPEAMIKVLNPTSVEQSVLRTSLLPGLLNVVKYNFDHQNKDIHGFEIGKIHYREGEQYLEQTVAGIILSGSAQPSFWGSKAREADFYDAKGILQNLFQEFGVEGVQFKPSRLSTFHNGRQASIFVGELEIGSIGEVHPALQRRLDVSQRIIFAEVSLLDLRKVSKEKQLMHAIPKFPSSERDWTVTLDESMPIQEVEEAILSISSPLLEKVHVLDLFRSDKLGANKKNATFHFIYRDSEKTVAQEEVDREHEKIVKEASKLLEKC